VKETSVNHHRNTVLVVDDDDDIRALICAVLTRAGYQCVSVNDGIAALAAAKADPPFAYVLDVRMPGMHGHEVCRRIKADDSICAPVLMVSAEAADTDIAAGYAAGCDDFMPKPFRPRELVARLEQFVLVAA
jgi:two-component system phosphate regulon response regulator PhoB